MRKIVRKIGNSTGILFNKEDQTTHTIKVGDIIEVKIKKIR